MHSLADSGKPPKQPYVFELSNGNLFAFAGVWDAWKDGQGHWLKSFAIVTTEANELMARIHPRMPVILRASDYDRWLDREETERLPVGLLRPFESEAMEMREANPKVNNARNNGPEMLERVSVATESEQLSLSFSFAAFRCQSMPLSRRLSSAMFRVLAFTNNDLRR
jgi:putative SOS response-associated peptidase YedK